MSAKFQGKKKVKKTHEILLNLFYCCQKSVFFKHLEIFRMASYPLQERSYVAGIPPRTRIRRPQIGANII